jgi:hypothetical protein
MLLWRPGFAETLMANRREGLGESRTVNAETAFDVSTTNGDNRLYRGVPVYCCPAEFAVVVEMCALYHAPC